MNATVKIIIVIFLYSTVNAQWEERINGLPDSWSLGASVDAVDENHAVLSLWDKIYITTDSGNSWNLIASEQTIPNLEVTDISMISPSQIWFSTSGVFPGNAKIYSTSDSGKTWRIEFEDPESTTFFNYIEMFDDNNGIAMGDAPVNSNKPVLFLKTTDGGDNWVPQNQAYFKGGFSGDLWRRVDFVNENCGYFFPSGVEPQRLYKTTDSGQTWQQTKFPGYAAVVEFANKNRGIIVGREGEVYITFDAAENWTIIKPEETGWPYDVEIIKSNPGRIWMVINKKLLYSYDFGFTWNELYISDEFTGIDIEFSDKDNGWLVAKDRVLFTSDGGLDFTPVEEEELPVDFELFQNYPNPFNPTTTIEYLVPNTETGEIPSLRLKIYNILGQELVTLVDEKQTAGRYKILFNTEMYNIRFNSGIYFYRLSMTVGKKEFVNTKKLMLLK